ncbi:substrate-binding periplasmic protein [Dongia rigui]|uniref:Transporter substrate-binding domain-containing protein n=1 Tax=Dongia rigui TaxID=940149 RepID=A0ABU5E005_9PROT|nr:transporter substrate-binding domain-containing protein [Dongia rigui]MDY0872223.1 transporter substrate-binding domain-containing protein [Dongia rigui]
MKRLLVLVFLALAATCANAAADEPFKVVAENDWYPYSALRDGKPDGMAVDLVRAAYAAAGAKVEFVSQPYARCLEEVEAGWQLGCFDTTREPATEARFRFHDNPLFSANIVIIAPVDSPAHDLGPVDLKNQRVAVTNGYTYGEPFQGDASVDKSVVKNDLSVLRVVAMKRVAYGVIYDKVMAHLLAEHGSELAGKVKIVGLLFQPDLYVSFSKKRPEATAAIAALDRGLEIIRKNGTYHEIEQRWAARFSVAGAPQ